MEDACERIEDLEGPRECIIYIKHTKTALSLVVGFSLSLRLMGYKKKKGESNIRKGSKL